MAVYQPEPLLLKRVRQEIDYNISELHKIIDQKSFKDIFGEITGDTIVRPPKGYDEDNPNIELLKLKNYIVHKNFLYEEVIYQILRIKSLKYTEKRYRFLSFWIMPLLANNF